MDSGTRKHWHTLKALHDTMQARTKGRVSIHMYSDKDIAPILKEKVRKVKEHYYLHDTSLDFL